MLGDARPGILAPETDDRPAVVASRLDDVDLVATVGPVLVVPELSGLRMHDERERVAVSERVDLRAVPGAVHKRIVWRHSAIVAKAKDLAAQTHWILRDLPDIPASREVHHAIAAEGDATVE